MPKSLFLALVCVIAVVAGAFYAAGSIVLTAMSVLSIVMLFAFTTIREDQNIEGESFNEPGKVTTPAMLAAVTHEAIKPASDENNGPEQPLDGSHFIDSGNIIDGGPF